MAKHDLDSDERPNKRPKVEDDNAVPAMDQQALDQDAQERAVGITTYVAPGEPGFTCVVKQRYTDFLVNEILPSGGVVHLTDFSVPKAAAAEAAPVETEKVSEPAIEALNGTTGAAEEAEPPAAELSADDKTSLVHVFGDDVTERIVKLYSGILRNPHRKPRDHPTLKSEVISEKTKRTEAHKLIRRIFNSKMQTETLQDQPGIIAIKAAPTKGASGARAEDSNRNQAKGRMGWTDLGGEYLHFTLYKENKDTMEALSFIASQLKIPAKGFQFAGTKDRRGVTVQRVAVFRVRAERIAGLNKLARGWRVGNFAYKPHGLGLGDLMGNEFLLTLRDCHFPDEASLSAQQRLKLGQTVVSKAAENFKRLGFLNYYGLQRFGSFSTGTHVTGMKMLQGDLKGAVDSILMYVDNVLPENVGNDASKVPKDDIARADTIRLWREGKISAADIRESMPRRFSAEATIMQYLSKKDKRTGKLVQEADYQGALSEIQKGLRLMYVHAYQSFVWNTVAGKRWELYGDKLVEGDLVIIGEEDSDHINGSKDEVDQDGELVVHPPEEDTSASKDPFTRARPLTQAEADSGKYNIFDLVLPQPGFDVEYPTNDIGKFYREFMGSEAGGRLDPHNMRRAWRDVSLSGAYRKLMARPLNGVVDWEIKECRIADQQLVETDLERMQKGEASSSEEVEAGAPANGAEHAQDAETAAAQIAVVLRFQLGSSQYATMALRELTKGGAGAYKPEYNTSR